MCDIQHDLTPDAIAYLEANQVRTGRGKSGSRRPAATLEEESLGLKPHGERVSQTAGNSYPWKGYDPLDPP